MNLKYSVGTPDDFEEVFVFAVSKGIFFEPSFLRECLERFPSVIVREAVDTEGEETLSVVAAVYTSESPTDKNALCMYEINVDNYPREEIYSKLKSLYPSAMWPNGIVRA